MGSNFSTEYNPYTGQYEYTGYQSELDRYNRRMYSQYNNSYYPTMGYAQQTPNYYNAYGVQQQQQYYPSAYHSPYNSLGYGMAGAGAGGVGYGYQQQAAYGGYNTPQYVSSMYNTPTYGSAYNNYYPYNVQQRPYM